MSRGRAAACLIAGLVTMVCPGRAPAAALSPSILFEPPTVGRIDPPDVQPVALEGDRISAGVIQSLGTARVNREGQIAFVAQVQQDGRSRRGLFTESAGRVTPLALEGQETGHGPLLVVGDFDDWAWNDGGRAVFLAPVDANGNGRYDAGVDPVFLFEAVNGSLTPLVRIGDRLDGGTLLAILSFRLNGPGQVAFQAQVDRNGNGRYDPGTDVAGLYLISSSRIQTLVREGQRLPEGTLRGLDTTGLQWQLNDQAEVVLSTGLQANSAAPLAEAIVRTDALGTRLLALTGFPTPAGRFSQLPVSSLDDFGNVAFPATVTPGLDRQFGLFFLAAQRPQIPELLVPPGVAGPDGSTLISDIQPQVVLADDGSVGFCGTYLQLGYGIDSLIPFPTACFVLTPGFLHEVVRQGAASPWGRIDALEELRLNNQGQAAVRVQADAYPFPPVPFPLPASPTGRDAILFWENGRHIAIVGPGDLIPGGVVGLQTQLVGVSDTSRLVFEATVTDGAGISRRGLYVVTVFSQAA